jgi:hypothetical protein
MEEGKRRVEEKDNPPIPSVTTPGWDRRLEDTAVIDKAMEGTDSDAVLLLKRAFIVAG